MNRSVSTLEGHTYDLEQIYIPLSKYVFICDSVNPSTEISMSKCSNTLCYFYIDIYTAK